MAVVAAGGANVGSESVASDYTGSSRDNIVKLVGFQRAIDGDGIADIWRTIGS